MYNIFIILFRVIHSIKIIPTFFLLILLLFLRLILTVLLLLLSPWFWLFWPLWMSGLLSSVSGGGLWMEGLPLVGLPPPFVGLPPPFVGFSPRPTFLCPPIRYALFMTLKQVMRTRKVNRYILQDHLLKDQRQSCTIFTTLTTLLSRNPKKKIQVKYE